MGLFGKKKDWNVIAIMFETKDQYRVNGNRAKGSGAETVRDAARNHSRSIFWAVFDQKRSFLEGGPGRGSNHVPTETLARLERDLLKIDTIRSVLSVLEQGKIDKAAKALAWSGHPSATHEG